MSRKPLTLPKEVTRGTRVWFGEGDGKLWLTDRRRGVQVAVIAVALLSVSAIVGGLVWQEAMQSLPVHQRNRQIDEVMASMCLIIFGVFALIVLPLVMIAKKSHRRFRVRVDDLRRTVRCERWWFGIKTGNRELEAREADWEIDSVYQQFKVKSGGADASSIVAGLILFAMGPLGWIIGALVSSSRNSSRRSAAAAEWQGKAMPRLTLLERGEAVARITIDDETTAQDFLLAWDRMTR